MKPDCSYFLTVRFGITFGSPENQKTERGKECFLSWLFSFERTDGNGNLAGRCLLNDEIAFEMLGTGIEPALLSEPEPTSGASASSATRAGIPKSYRFVHELS